MVQRPVCGARNTPQPHLISEMAWVARRDSARPYCQSESGRIGRGSATEIGVRETAVTENAANETATNETVTKRLWGIATAASASSPRPAQHSGLMQKIGCVPPMFWGNATDCKVLKILAANPIAGRAGLPFNAVQRLSGSFAFVRRRLP